MHAPALALFPTTLGILTLLSSPALADDVTVTLDASSGFVVEDNTGAIERLRVDESTGNVSRNGALFVHTTGTDNTFVGEGAGNLSMTGLGRNSAFGKAALASNTTGSANSALGHDALRYNTTGSFNSGFGEDALSSNTTGFDNSGFGQGALSSNTTGFANSAFGERALYANTTGRANSAFGRTALRANTTGILNSAFGFEALYTNTTGERNSAFGERALRDNTIGLRNSAFGRYALRDNTTGSDNSGFGYNALRYNTTGSENSAFGRYALSFNTTGNFNAAIGRLAGLFQTTGNHNIYLSNRGVAGESGQIKIGTVGLHTQATIVGIHGNIVAGGIGVLVDSNGALGTTTSSMRFKEAVRDMGASSEMLMKLRPVTFRYREAVAQGEDVPEYGLIAEEVADVAPELVAYDGDGEPYSVRYHVLPSLLLNEVQKQQGTIEEQHARLGLEAERNAVQEVQIATLLARLDVLESQLAGESTGTDR